MKPAYVIATFLKELNASQPSMFKFGAHKLFRDPTLRLQPSVDVRVVKQAKKLLVKTLQKRVRSRDWWDALRDLCEPYILPPASPSPKKKSVTRKPRSRAQSRTRTRAARVPKAKARRTKAKAPAVKNLPKVDVDKVQLLEQELAATRNELTAARNAAAAAQQAASAAAAAVESLTKKINIQPHTQTPERNMNKHKRSSKHKRSPDTDTSPSSAESPVQTPRWFRKYNKRMRRNLNTTLGGGRVPVPPMIMNNMCMGGSPTVIGSPPIVHAPALMGFPMYSMNNTRYW